MAYRRTAFRVALDSAFFDSLRAAHFGSASALFSFAFLLLRRSWAGVIQVLLALASISRSSLAAFLRAFLARFCEGGSLFRNASSAEASSSDIFCACRKSPTSSASLTILRSFFKSCLVSFDFLAAPWLTTSGTRLTVSAMLGAVRVANS